MLGLKNGFYAFESALHVFPAGEGLGTTGVQEWNSRSLWRHSYGKLVDGMFFFAEDIFGGQFCVKDGAIYGFDPETADVTLIGQDLEEWAQAVLDDYDLQTGYSIAQEWQLQNGPLSPSDRLMPKIPFVLGGAFDISNLVAIERARGMRTRGNLATQIHDLPDGSQIRFDIVD
ncbi:SMI1/KNR4 family protein [Pseudoduganella flava]|uniref:SMI1/KNR4 family protein n=1 Tax=Pseudoduganella flava TaxID=871742 RepID=A0ABX6G211_9BURK|nr:SMI1/KNR4 family protein [Pseudoduganella flava]